MEGQEKLDGPRMASDIANFNFLVWVKSLLFGISPMLNFPVCNPGNMIRLVSCFIWHYKKDSCKTASRLKTSNELCTPDGDTLSWGFPECRHAPCRALRSDICGIITRFDPVGKEATGLFPSLIEI